MYRILLINLLIQITTPKLLYPPREDISSFKPVQLQPESAICGLDLKETLCDNRFQDSTLCFNDSSIIHCSQICPYGNMFLNLNDNMPQLNLERQNPCEILKDYGKILAPKSKSAYSYLFDRYNNICNDENMKTIWSPFELHTIWENFLLNSKMNLVRKSIGKTTYSEFNSGFTVTFWFQQATINNGTLLHLFRDANMTVLHITVSTSEQRVYLEYYCGISNSPLQSQFCSIEINTKQHFFNSPDSNNPNFLAFKIYKNQLELFINGPGSLNESPTIPIVYLNYDLGSFIINSIQPGKFFISQHLSGLSNYYGWIQDVRIFLIPLTNAEIFDLFRPYEYSVFIQPECRCPNEAPRNQDKYSVYCMSNHLNKTDKLRRVNEFSHDIGFLNDDDFKTTWISCISTSPVKLNMDFVDGSYILQRIEIYFSSLPPLNLILERYFNNKWHALMTYSRNCTSSDRTCTKMPEVFGDEILGGYVLVWSIDSLLDKANSLDALFSDPALIDRAKASKFRLTLSDYYPVIKNDIRQLYYSINEIKIYANCDCNGYSATCDKTSSPYKCNCDVDSNTNGANCEKCLSLYNQNEYQSRYLNLSATCSLCNCNNRADSCYFDSNKNKTFCSQCSSNYGGDVCDKCADNAFFDSITETCVRCACKIDGVLNTTNICDQKTGQCLCKPNVDSTDCRVCKPGYFNFSRDNPLGCTKCDCNPEATLILPGSDNLAQCDTQTGQCKCKTNFVQGYTCDSCTPSMYNLALGCTSLCKCDPYGSLSPTCDKQTGQCSCKPNVAGFKCSTCQPGFYNLTSLGCTNRCTCNPIGSADSTICNIETGSCFCRDAYTGKNCDICKSGYWKSNNKCVKCECNLSGVKDLDNICEQTTGKCLCDDFSDGFNCENCKLGYYGGVNLQTNSSTKCEKCKCDAKGTKPSSLKNGAYICDGKTSQCLCKENRMGLMCESCAVGYFLLDLGDIDCFQCSCSSVGSIPGSNCDKITGECACKIANGIGGTRCDSCRPGYYGFSKETGSCFECGCNLAGSLNQRCDPILGSCECKNFVTGTKCDRCKQGTSNLEFNNPFGCSKKPSKQSPPTLSILSATSVQVTWIQPDYPNGVIIYFILYRNESVVFNSTAMSFQDMNLDPFTVYSYKVASFNSEGNTVSRLTFVTIKLPTKPCCKFDFRISNIRSRSLEIQWIPPVKLNGMNPIYFINIYSLKNKTHSIVDENLSYQSSSSISVAQKDLIQEDGVFRSKIDKLMPYKNYLITISCCNKDLVNEVYYCLNGTGIFDTIFKSVVYKETFLQFFTSEDRPEEQPAPVIKSLNSTYAIVGVLKPVKPNGIILLYQVWLKKLTSNTISRIELMCSIEEWYDPNIFNTDQNINAPKICIINNLYPNTKYQISATSSNIIGSSLLSTPLEFNTLEEEPKCSVNIEEAVSKTSNSIYLRLV